HIHEPRYRTRRIVRVECTEDEMSGESGTNCDIGSFEIADFADHDHVRILADDVPQSCRECKTDLRVHMDLVDTIHLILDGIFDGDDLANRTVDALQGTVKRRALSTACRTSNQKYSMRFGSHLADLFVKIVRKAQPPEIDQ